ncbi:MAG TPA: hypothetical protein VID47_04555 [Actinomycetota bacterium]|jgi:hypothetical protein
MPDRPDDSFDDDLREGLESLAGEAAPPAKAPTSVLSSARRRVAWNSAALVVAVVLVIGGVVAGYGLTGGNGSTPAPIGSLTGPSPVPTSARPTSVPPTSAPVTSAPSTSAPSPVPAPSFGPWTGPNDTMMFIDGVVYRFFLGSEQPAVIGLSPDATAVQSPVSTPYGVVVLGRQAGHETHLWLLPKEGGPAQELATNTDGFAVSADGSQIAFATLNHAATSSTLRVLSLSQLPAPASATIDTYVRVVGFALGEVVVDTGDGAAAQAATWTPGSSSISPLQGHGRAIATDPASGFAVLTEGDGTCWVIAALGPSGNAGHGPPKRGDGCGIDQASFDPSGDAMTAIESASKDRYGPRQFVLSGTTSLLGGGTEIKGAFQTWWARPSAGGPGSILVLTEAGPGMFTVLECRVSENLCPFQVWMGTGAEGEGTTWIVEERPAPR